VDSTRQKEKVRISLFLWINDNPKNFKHLKNYTLAKPAKPEVRAKIRYAGGEAALPWPEPPRPAHASTTLSNHARVCGVSGTPHPAGVLGDICLWQMLSYPRNAPAEERNT
jgi:hypothetical protein